MSSESTQLEALVLGAVRDTPLLVIVFDRARSVGWLNPAAEEALGVGRDAIVGQPADRLVQGGLPALQGGASREEGTFALVRDDGRLLHVQGRLSRVRDPAGRRLGTALVASLTAAGSQWHHHLLRGTLPAAMGMMGAEVAHKINNPATWLRLNLDELLTDLCQPAEMDVALVRQLLDECREGLDRISEIASELRQLAGPGPGELQQTDLRHLVAAACSLAPLTSEGAVMIRRELADVPRLSLAPGRVGQAVWAVLSLCVRLAEPGQTLPALHIRLHDDGQHVFVDLCVDRPLQLPEGASHAGARSAGPPELRMARTVLAAHGGLVMAVPEGHGMRLQLPIVAPPNPLV